MNNFFRTIIAAWGAKKLGGGCLSTIVIFIVIYTLLGKCNQPARASEAAGHIKTEVLAKPSEANTPKPAGLHR
ncbi:hypothetical protein MUGA111182_01390 [Mucilaginibacter galii]|uniref:Uncharacterized protein n=1 Tax=Mucilaginibacter galii TaxID=2005073 RepID=A0A917MZE1_9SPHI|nr:hypothetical protein [Mucilaginibacter galii]GGI48891.1 hypothetical protein GCM10011425_01030 [Mucilaginibacter galii]